MLNKIEFQNKKIEELQKQCDDNQRFFDDKISTFSFNLLGHFKTEVQEESQSQIDRVTSEKEFWENKYEQKRKALKELELALARGQAEHEKKASSLQ